MSPDNHQRRILHLIVGIDRARTISALALAVGFGVATAWMRIYAPSAPDVVFGVLHAFTLEANPPAVPIEGFGVLTVFAIAGIHAYLNEGYVPSIILATAPSYGHYVFNGPGAAPIWAVEYVFPFAVTAGTLGFLVGVAVRWSQGGGQISRQLGHSQHR